MLWILWYVQYWKKASFFTQLSLDRLHVKHDLVIAYFKLSKGEV